MGTLPNTSFKFLFDYKNQKITVRCCKSGLVSVIGEIVSYANETCLGTGSLISAISFRFYVFQVQFLFFFYKAI